MKIVILPGLDGTGAFLNEINDLLSSEHDVTIVRYPTDLCRYDDLLRFVKSHLPEDDFVLVAESFSGPLAVMIAADNPMGLKGIVFVATFAKTPLKVPKFLTYAVDIMPIKSRLFVTLAQPFLMGRWATREFTAEFRQVMKGVPTSTVAGRLREVLNVDIVDRLSRVAVPTLYLAAKNDRIVPARMSQAFDRAPNAIVALDGPHFLLQANAPDAAKHILRFIKAG